MDTGKHLVRALAVSVVIALLAAVAAFAKPQIIRAGNVFLKDNGGISPSKLPKRTPVPISAHIDAEIGTTDGTHIPAVRSLDLDFDKSFVLNAKGLPACRLGQLEARPTDAAKKACPGAIVGSGDGVVEVAFPEQAPFSARGPIVLFNGGVRNGTLSLFVHTYVSVPAPTAVVVPVKITRIHRGHFGIHAVAAVPGDRRRGRLGHPVPAGNRPQVHLPRQEAELPLRHLPDRDLLHRRQDRIRGRNHPPRHPPSALHAKELGIPTRGLRR